MPLPFEQFRFCSLRPWRRGLITTTGLTLILFVAVQLWNAGWAEWAFVATFFAVWALTSIMWSNDDYIEESGGILAGIMDQNFHQLHERLTEIEHELGKWDDTMKEDSHRVA